MTLKKVLFQTELYHYELQKTVQKVCKDVLKKKNCYFDSLCRWYYTYRRWCWGNGEIEEMLSTRIWNQRSGIFLGMEVAQTKKGIIVSKKIYTWSINWDGNEWLCTAKTPMEANQRPGYGEKWALVSALRTWPDWPIPMVQPELVTCPIRSCYQNRIFKNQALDCENQLKTSKPAKLVQFLWSSLFLKL